MAYFYPYSDYSSFPYRNSHPFLSRGSWTSLSWVEKYHYAFSGPFNKPEMALTFDDGPDPVFTPQILDLLKKYGINATFFLLGQNIEKYPDMAKRIAAEGHVIGNHTYDHPKSVDLSLTDFVQQLQKTDEIIQKLIGYRPKFFRPPYGSIKEDQLQWTNEQGKMVIQWSIDTLDWQGLPATNIVDTVLTNALPGSIILQHNAAGVPLQGSVEALDQFIPGLQQKEVRFVTLPEMFNTDKNI